MKNESTRVSGTSQVECASPGIFARLLEPREGEWLPGAETSPSRLNLDKDQVKHGLGRLVLALVKLLHELLERQAIRRMEANLLSPEEIERLGGTLMRQAQEINRLRQEFGLEEADLSLDLGPLGRLFKE
ncbi:MAG: gas vesicle protein K [Desulfobaccales bacterium]